VVPRVVAVVNVSIEERQLGRGAQCGSEHCREQQTDCRNAHGRVASERAYCGLIPAALITFADSSISVCRNLVNSSGVIGTGSAPSAAKRSFTSADCAAARTSCAIFSMTACGVPTGANKPTQSE